MEFTYISVAYAGVVLFLAYMVRGIAGFGSGLISVPLLAFYFPVQTVVPFIVLFDYIGSASQGIRNRDQISWREQIPLVPFTLLGVAMGLFLLKGLTSATLSQSLGGFIIAYAIYQLLPLPDLRGGRYFVVPCGGLGGLVGTLFGTGGPFYIIYFGLRGLQKERLRATFAVNFLIDGAIRLAAYLSFGLFDPQGFLIIGVALPIVAAGLWIGGRVHSTMEPRTYAKLISVLLLGSGVVLLLKN